VAALVAPQLNTRLAETRRWRSGQPLGNDRDLAPRSLVEGWLAARRARVVVIGLRMGAGLAGFKPATHGPGNRCEGTPSPRDAHY
jgi:hypothetical protein